MAAETGPGIGELRADIRDWRRGRATASVMDVLQDVYVAVFAVVMLGAMLVNVVVGFRREADDLCVAAGCLGARAVLPWLTIAATLAAVLALARLLGPVFTTPAAGAWLLSTPVDRGALLRRRFVVLSAVAAAVVLAVAVPATALAGLPVLVVVAIGAVVAVLGIGVVAVAAVSQRRGRAESRWLLWLLLVITWAGLLALAIDESPSFGEGPRPGVAWASLVVAAVAVVPLVVAGRRGLAALRRRQLEPGGNLSSGLSGALATLDLALAYDVVVAHTARIRGTVRSYRGGPRGPLALVWRDVIRLRRRPMPLLVVASVVVAPYAVAQAGGGRLTVLVATLVGFVGAVPLCLALRVVTRTPALARMMPFTSAVARGCTLAVPAVVLVAFGLACAPALGSAMSLDGGVAGQLGLSVGAGALTSTAWWMAARPVNYSVPAVSTPMGALPPGMISGALRGPDMVLVSSAPMLISPTATGAAVAFWLCAAVLAYLVLRR